MMKTALYLFPMTLGEDTPLEQVLPCYNIDIISQIQHFIVEDIRTARRFLKRCNRQIDIDSLTFYTLNKHTTADQISSYLNPLEKGYSMGVISEAGCPAIADPGADVVRLAQQKKLHIVPLIGPSSILLSLMASGFNGQSFAFHGYLPIDEAERSRRIKYLENELYQKDQTQLFIETPYRNHKLLEDLIKCCNPKTMLCVACEITCPTQQIITLPISQWKQQPIDLHKRPTIFLLYK